MKLRTELQISPNEPKIGYHSRLISIGSCFSQLISSNLRHLKWTVAPDFYGTIFNPLSIFELIDRSLENKPIEEALFTERHGVWNHFSYHSSLADTSRLGLLENIETRQWNAHQKFTESDTLFITFGTAFVYELKEHQRLVANCHKVPGDHFFKKLLTPEDITRAFRLLYPKLNHFSNIVLTVSPVRHVKDTLTLNAVSKSVLRLACHQILYEFPHVKYFPAYEYLLDDLRDYRYYADDLLHPSEQAESYIFDKFCEAYIDQESLDLMKNVKKLMQSVQHRAFLPQSEPHQKFLRETIIQMERLMSKIDFSEELRLLKAQLT